MRMILFVYLAISSSFLFSNGYHHQRCQSRSIIRNQNVLFQSEPTSNFIEQQQRPRPVGLPRRRMELPFAVLLMRTSYSVADDLDFVAMDEFQRSFFLYRQSEWESYRDQHPRVMQGDLADPAYFDFISFAQYVVLSDKMKNGKVDFVEKVGAEGETVSVHRDDKWSDNSLLPTLHSTSVGDKILQFMYDTYPASILPTSRVRTDNEAHSTEALKDFISDSQLLLDIFTFNSFALNMTITEVKGNEQKSKSSNKPKSTEIVSSAPSVYAVIRSQFPANLWSQQSLRLRKDTPTNDYDIKMLASFARKCNIAFEWLSTTVQNDIDVAHMIRIS